MAQQRVETLISLVAAAAGTVNGGAIGLDSLRGAWLATVESARVSGSGALDAKIQDGMSESGPWFDWITFTQITGATGSEIKVPTREALPFKRIVYTVAASTTQTFNVKLAGYYA